MQRRLSTGSYFGDLVARRQAGGFLFTECVYSGNTRIPPHVHENPFFYFVVEGCCSEVLRATRRDRGPATLVFHPAGEEHADCWPEAGRCFHIEIPAGALSQMRERVPVIDAPAEFRGPGPAGIASRLYGESRATDSLSELALHGLVLELLVETSRAARPAGAQPPQWLGEVQDLLHARFNEPVSLEEIAAAVGVHAAHLTRVFRQHYRCSVGDYLRRLRVEYARRELTRSAAPLLEIALEAGFSDQSHFTRVFKEQTGTTPGDYRRQHPGTARRR